MSVDLGPLSLDSGPTALLAVGLAWPCCAASWPSLMSARMANASLAVVVVGSEISATLMFLTLLASSFFLSVPTALILIAASGALSA